MIIFIIILYFKLSTKIFKTYNFYIKNYNLYLDI